MAEALISGAEPISNPDGVLDPVDPSPSGSLFHRRIEFHLAKKPFTGFSNGSGDFRLETLNPSSEPQRTGSNQGGGGPSSLPVKKPDMSKSLENGLDPEFSFGITFRRIGAGLENLGNTCFLNSVLQCLTYTEPLAAYLQSGKHQNSCRTAGFCALCAIQKHVSRALQSTGRILAPKDLVSNLRCISRTFRNSRQEDAHEYMVNLLESMHKCCLPSGVPSESPSAYDRSLVHKIFGGRLRSQVKCMQCSFCSDKFDPFLDLSLEIVKADSLYKALSHFTAKEQLDGGERQYQCQRCKQKVRALKQLTVHKAPYVLTIHLKRFGSHSPGQKIDRKVHFGPTLDLKPFVTGPYDGDLKYTLYGVLVHAGWSTHSGHYYCFVRTSTGMWYSLDDNRVVQVNERTVLDQKAYMLFYVRDRRNSTPKKPIDVVQRNNTAIHAMGNKPHSNNNQDFKEAIQNGPMDKKLNSSDSSATVCERDTKGSLSEPPSKVPLLKDPVKLEDLNEEKSTKKEQNDSIAIPSICGGIQNSVIKKEQNDSITIPPSSGKISIKKETSGSVSTPPSCNGNIGTKKDLSDSVCVPPKCNGLNESDGDVGKTTQTIVNEASSQGHGRKAPEEKDPLRPLNRTGNGDCKIEGFSKEDVLVDSANEKGDDIVQRRTKTFNHRPRIILKKKILKSPVTSLHFGPNILLGASLALWKKKKHKMSKHRNLEIKSLTTDLGPSTSEKTRTVSPVGSSHSKRKKSKSDPIKKDNSAVTKNGTNSNGDSLLGTMDKEFRERDGQNGSVLATDKISQKCSNSDSARIQGDAKGANISNDVRKESIQNGWMNILTRGLEETVVARWDEIELPPARVTYSNGVGNVRIGHVGDEWDEEYDRGKRKKVRNCQYDFGGSNPFQEIATKKAKLNKTKMEHSSIGNQPFRIL